MAEDISKQLIAELRGIGNAANALHTESLGRPGNELKGLRAAHLIMRKAADRLEYLEYAAGRNKRGWDTIQKLVEFQMEEHNKDSLNVPKP